MYRLMKDQALAFIADLFLNLQEGVVAEHDFLAESMALQMKK